MGRKILKYGVIVLVLLFIGIQSFQGQLFWVYILNYSVIRSVVEMFRGDSVRGFLVPGFSISQGISVLMFASAVLMLVILGKKRPASV